LNYRFWQVNHLFLYIYFFALTPVSSLVTNEGARKNINNLAVSQVTAALVIFLMRTSPNPCNYVILAGLAVLIQTYKNSCKVIERYCPALQE